MLFVWLWVLLDFFPYSLVCFCNRYLIVQEKIMCCTLVNFFFKGCICYLITKYWDSWLGRGGTKLWRRLQEGGWWNIYWLWGQMIFLSVFVIHCIMLLTLMSDLHLISPTISPMNHSLRSWEWRKWSPILKALDC